MFEVMFVVAMVTLPATVCIITAMVINGDFD